jgi:hypothetical protein
MANPMHVREQVHPDFKFKLFEYGLEYYVAGRFTVMARMTMTPGSQFHHAIELMLKAQMAKTLSLADVKTRFRHGLVELWEAFKAEFPNEDLTAYDSTISELHRFWQIRYPDDLLQNGAQLGFSWEGPAILSSSGPAVQNVPTYQISVRTLDRLVVKLAKLVSINVAAFLPMIAHSDIGRSVLTYDGDDIRGWLGGLHAAPEAKKKG